MPRWFAVALGLAVLAAVLWFWLRPRPSLDLDRLEDTLAELRAAQRLARGVADIDALPAYLQEEAAHLDALTALLSAPPGDCRSVVDEALRRHREHQELIATREDWLTPERLQALPAAERQQAGLKAVYVLAPAWQRLGPAVEAFAQSCPRESGELAPILFAEGSAVSP